MSDETLRDMGLTRPQERSLDAFRSVTPPKFASGNVPIKPASFSYNEATLALVKAAANGGQGHVTRIKSWEAFGAPRAPSATPASGGSSASASSATPFAPLPAAQFIPDRKERQAFFNACAAKELNYAYRQAELAKRLPLLTQLGGMCAQFCMQTYPSISELPRESYEKLIIPKDGLQSCHLEALCDLSTGFLHARLAHANAWVETNGCLPFDLQLQREKFRAAVAVSTALFNAPIKAAEEKAKEAAAQSSAHLAELTLAQQQLAATTSELEALKQALAATAAPAASAAQPSPWRQFFTTPEQLLLSNCPITSSHATGAPIPFYHNMVTGVSVWDLP